MIYENISDMIGDTPLLKINPKVTGLKHIDIYAKMECMNPFGSVKDRVGKALIEEVLEKAQKNNMTIVEASSGNTAKAMAILCANYGLNFKTVTNRIKQPEVRMILQMLGADIQELPGLSDCPDPMDPNDFTTVAANLAKTDPDKYHYTDQYFNKLNLDNHYQTTGKEILDDLGHVDYYFGFLGTCGSSMGVGQYLKDQDKGSEIWGVVASAGHHVPGGRNINELWEVGFFRRDFFAGLLEGTAQQAVESMIELNRGAGVLCGPTGGLTYYAAIQKLREVDATMTDKDERKKAVFIACDRMEPYTSFVKKYKPELFMKSSGARKTVESQEANVVEMSPMIEPKELETCIDDPKTLVVDVRGTFAYSIGHIPGSINILDELFSQMIEQGNIFPMDRKIVVVCSVGTISRKYASFLKSQGYDAYSLKQGVNNWKKSGLTLEKSKQNTEPSDNVAVSG